MREQLQSDRPGCSAAVGVGAGCASPGRRQAEIAPSLMVPHDRTPRVSVTALKPGVSSVTDKVKRIPSLQEPEQGSTRH